MGHAAWQRARSARADCLRGDGGRPHGGAKPAGALRSPVGGGHRECEKRAMTSMKTHRLWLLLIAAPIVLAVHAVGVLTVSDMGHAILGSDQRVSFAIGGFLVIV